MILFLTSSPTGALDGSDHVDGLDPRNGFTDALHEYWPEDPARCVIISAFPDEPAACDGMRSFFHAAFEASGLPCACFDVWDRRTADRSGRALGTYDVVLLGGGHVPTENAWFHEIGLRKSLQGFGGIVIGISAGSMNCAETVYAQPEEPGEAADPDYRRFLPGLGLTDLNILPHYQAVKDNVLDGLRLFEDITFGDSFGRRFLAIPDGSFVLQTGTERAVFGESLVISDGRCTVLTGPGGYAPLG